MPATRLIDSVCVGGGGKGWKESVGLNERVVPARRDERSMKRVGRAEHVRRASQSSRVRLPFPFSSPYDSDAALRLNTTTCPRISHPISPNNLVNIPTCLSQIQALMATPTLVPLRRIPAETLSSLPRPSLKIKIEEDVAVWRETQAYRDYGVFLRRLNESVVGCPLPWNSPSLSNVSWSPLRHCVCSARSRRLPQYCRFWTN